MGAGRYCFDVDAFAADDFSVSAFLEECRARNPMETVHQDLRDFQTSLENQLVTIINEDYAEFLQLSSKLKGVDEAVSSVRQPILAVLKRVDSAHQAISQLQARVHSQLRAFGALHAQERDLLLSIRVSERLLLIEELLEISSPLDEAEDAHDAPTATATTRRQHSENALSDTEDDDNGDSDDDGFDNFDAVRALVTRDSSAAETCARLERATQNLVELELEFDDGADIPTVQREEKRLAVVEETLLRRLETEFATEIFPDTFYAREHAISAATLSFLLRAYVNLQRSEVPEEMVGRLLMRPFAEETMTRGKLDGRVRGSCEGLPQIYDAVLDFVAHKLGAVLALPVCQGESRCSVDLLGNAVWKPLFDVLASKHSVVFQAADPDRFHRSYTQSMQFLARMEQQFCATEAMTARFRSHESVVEFKDKWNLDVYFQLRSAQLAASLERAFGAKRAELPPELSLSSAVPFRFESSTALWRALQDCWAAHVFLEPLAPSFSKLCAQLLLHYVDVWRAPLVDAVNQLTGGGKVDFSALPLYFVDSEEDIVCAGSDFHVLRDKITNELFPIVAQCVEPFVDNSSAFVAEFFEEPLASLEEMETCCWSAAAVAVADECKKVLPALRTVKGQYQMTNKPPPTAPSLYVTSIISPLGDFVGKWGAHFVGARREQLFRAVLDDVCEVYGSLSAELLKSAQELEESLKSRKMQRNVPSALVAAASVSDTDKMRMQLRLDLEEMQRQVLELGFQLEACSSFQRTLASLS
ncbi:hypothetical protein PybrP1_000319 [[Pythium] brassicae (nom. inval.)]|nr:hypothetical protein PybrP1_000319 [[Pythium] brassicae (nom. inval.)]